MSKLTDFIKVYDDAIPPDFCDTLVQHFDDKNVPKAKFEESYRRCHSLSTLDSSSHWGKFKGIMSELYNRYRNEIKNGTLAFANTIEAPNIFRYDPDTKNPNFFHLHTDCWNFPTATRQVSVIIYLNDVKEGGGTTFERLGLTVQPRKGRVLLFPSNILFYHKGDPPISESKYIIVSWIHFDGSGHAYRVHRL